MKAIFFDIDGTLVSKKAPHMSDALLEAFNQLRKKGILLFIATGRHFLEIEELGLTKAFTFDGYVTLNGAYCYVDTTIIHKECIDKKDANSIHKYLLEHSVSASYVEEKEIYCNKIDNNLLLAYEEIHTPIPKVKEIQTIDNLDIYMFCLYIDNRINELIDVTRNCVYTQWFSLGYDIVSKNCRKDVGVQKMLEYFQIDTKEAMAFGDGQNDMDMLKYVQLGVCMGNGTKEAKQISDFVTKDVDNEGIIFALQHFAIL